MFRIHVLGSGDGCAGSRRDTSSLAVETGSECTLVDCPGSAVHKLARLGTDLSRLTRLVVTHNHVDHIYGFAHLAHALVLAPERPPLRVYAPEQALETLQAMLQLHGLEADCATRLELRGVAMDRGVVVDTSASCRILATPAMHSRETLALRLERGGRSCVYASDTGRSDAVTDLSAGADLLFHDCAGPHDDVAAFDGQHCSARQAGEVAAAAAVRELRLTHIVASDERGDEALVREARQVFAGKLGIASDGDTHVLSPAG